MPSAKYRKFKREKREVKLFGHTAFLRKYLLNASGEVVGGHAQLARELPGLKTPRAIEGQWVYIPRTVARLLDTAGVMTGDVIRVSCADNPQADTRGQQWLATFAKADHVVMRAPILQRITP